MPRLLINVQDLAWPSQLQIRQIQCGQFRDNLICKRNFDVDRIDRNLSLQLLDFFLKKSRREMRRFVSQPAEGVGKTRFQKDRFQPGALVGQFPNPFARTRVRHEQHGDIRGQLLDQKSESWILATCAWTERALRAEGTGSRLPVIGGVSMTGHSPRFRRDRASGNLAVIGWVGMSGDTLATVMVLANLLKDPTDPIQLLRCCW